MPRELATTDICSIHYCFEGASNQDRRLYSSKVTTDLLLRGLSPGGNLAEKQTRLRESLCMEFNYRKLSIDVEHGEKGVEGALFLLINAVPCILHMENRVGLKITTMLISEGLSLALAGNTFAENSALGEAGRMKLFFAELNTRFNTMVWGTPTSPTQWECPYDKATKELGILCLDNNKTRQAINKLEVILDLCIVDPDRSGQWNRCVENYRSGMILVRQKDEFEDRQIFEFQKHMDLFFQDWILLQGAEGITNYIHLLSSGHVAHYMFHWRNLYVHSQQG